MTQAAIKVLSPDKINFQIQRMIWSWKKAQITSMVYHAIQLGYHPTEWKRAQRILLQKGEKRDFGLIRFYRAISLLNYMGKVVEKLVANKFFLYCKNYSKLHLRQMSGRKKRLAIDVVATLVHIIHEKWEEKKLAAVLFIDIKGAFDHVSKGQLLNRIIELNINGDLINWTGSFLTNRKV